MIAALAIVMIFLAPFALLVMGGLAAILLVILWLKTAIRERRLIAAFSPAEGALALSALLFTVGAATAAGLWIARLGFGEAVSLGGAMMPLSGGPKPGWRSVWYSNAETQQRLKDGLTKAGIPFRTRTEGGKEYVSWPPEHDAAAEKISEEARSGPVTPAKRSIAFGTAETQKEFVTWLTKRGIKSAIVPRDGKQYVEWEETAETREIFEAFLKERSRDCKDAKAKAKC